MVVEGAAEMEIMEVPVAVVQEAAPVVMVIMFPTNTQRPEQMVLVAVAVVLAVRQVVIPVEAVTVEMVWSLFVDPRLELRTII